MCNVERRLEEVEITVTANIRSNSVCSLSRNTFQVSFGVYLSLQVDQN